MSTWPERFRERQARHQDRINLYRSFCSLVRLHPEKYKIGYKKFLGLQFYLMIKKRSTVHEIWPGVEITKTFASKDWTVLETSDYWHALTGGMKLFNGPEPTPEPSDGEPLRKS